MIVAKHNLGSVLHCVLCGENTRSGGQTSRHGEIAMIELRKLRAKKNEPNRIQ